MCMMYNIVNHILYIMYLSVRVSIWPHIYPSSYVTQQVCKYSCFPIIGLVFVQFGPIILL